MKGEGVEGRAIARTKHGTGWYEVPRHAYSIGLWRKRKAGGGWVSGLAHLILASEEGPQSHISLLYVRSLLAVDGWRERLAIESDASGEAQSAPGCLAGEHVE